MHEGQNSPKHLSYSERKVEAIEERLARIETLLENLTSLSTAIQHSGLPTPSSAASASRLTQIQPSITNITPKTENVSVQRPASRTPSRGDQGLKADSNANAAFEGASSLSAHSVHASRIIESAMSDDYTAFTRDPKMQEALFALRNLIEKQHASPVNHDYRFPTQQADPSYIDFSSAKMPPIESVVSLLRLCKGKI